MPRQELLNLVGKLIEFSKVEDMVHLEYGIYLNDMLIGFVNDCGIEADEIEIGYVNMINGHSSLKFEECPYLCCRRINSTAKQT